MCRVQFEGLELDVTIAAQVHKVLDRVVSGQRGSTVPEIILSQCPMSSHRTYNVAEMYVQS